MLHDQLFFEETTFILSGESNTGKTTTLNSILSYCLDKPVQFFTQNSLNATKVQTFIHFIPEDEKLKAFTVANGKKQDNIAFENLEECIKSYNKQTSECQNIMQTNQIHIYIPTSKMPHNLMFTDLPGDNLEMKNNNLLRNLQTQHPNHIVLNFIKDLNHSSYSKDALNILTHVDMINYERDPTMKTKHKEFLKLIQQQKIIFLSNTNDELSEIKLDDETLPVYNKNTISHFLGNQHQVKQRMTAKSLGEFDQDETLINSRLEATELLNHIWLYNKKALRDRYHDGLSYYDYTPKNEIIKKIDWIYDHLKSIENESGIGPAMLLIELKIERKKYEECDQNYLLGLIEKENQKKHVRDWRNVLQKFKDYLFVTNEQKLKQIHMDMKDFICRKYQNRIREREDDELNELDEQPRRKMRTE